jgi:hypothetical protein
MTVGSSDMGDGSDLIGDVSGQEASGQSGAGGGALNAVNSGIEQASQDADKQKQQLETERKLVKQKMIEYAEARDFDKAARMTYAQDRKYAAGLSDPSWASDANLIGSFIDILTSFLYAQNPDVSVKAAEQVGNQPNDDNTQFAESMELIVSALWRKAILKKAAKRMVRSSLSVGIGWVKALMWSAKRPQPTVEKELHTAEAQAARLSEQITIAREKGDDCDDTLVNQAHIAALIAGLRAKIMLNKNYGMNVDHCRSEDIQISLDVSSTQDYLSADWMSEDIYKPKKSLRALFPVLTEEDVQRATVYYQKNVPANAKGDILQAATGDEASDGTYSKVAPTTQMGGGKPVEFVKIVEFWDRRDSNIYTMCDGIERWLVVPYVPPQASTRFYPYFGLELFPVDGHRHPQSLAWRLRKLQDEYAACRSNQRLTRERSIPGLIFNRGAMSPEDAKKLESSVIAEMVGIAPTDINVPLQTIIMAKPLPTVDTRLWDSSSIRMDMESISGVQEALQQQTSQQPKTATEAQIQQTGFASRTAADRDTLEDVLTDLAIYTGETSIQEIDPNAAQRIAGPMVFWPAGMDVQDLLTMVDIQIDAGTTGKPNMQADKANWATILPMLQKLVVQVRQVQQTDPALADALKALLEETLKRMDDRLDINQFFPQTPPPPQPKPAPPPPNVSVQLKGVLPALDAAVIGANAAGLPPDAINAAGGAGGPPAIQPGAPDHPGAHIADGEIPLHPHMPEPLPAAQKTPEKGGDTQKPTT